MSEACLRWASSIKLLRPLSLSSMRHLSKASHSDSTTPEQEFQSSSMSPGADVPEASILLDATLLPFKDINPPRLYKISEPFQVPANHGRIIMAMYNWRCPAMQ